MVLSSTAAAHDRNAKHKPRHEGLAVQGVYAAEGRAPRYSIQNTTMALTSLFRHPQRIQRVQTVQTSKCRRTCRTMAPCMYRSQPHPDTYHALPSSILHVRCVHKRQHDRKYSRLKILINKRTRFAHKPSDRLLTKLKNSSKSEQSCHV